jgi:hypothetical protein
MDLRLMPELIAEPCGARPDFCVRVNVAYANGAYGVRAALHLIV